MSGLAARFQRDSQPVDTAMVWTMLNAAPYRGPDGMWVRGWEQAALGFAKLAITPEEADEQQPLLSPRSGCAIIADVRLDNRDDLLAQLPEHPASDTSDAELILRAYEAWGVDSVTRLLGDFAYVIWDPREMRLVCARDTSGQRALFYYLDRSTFIAASEIHQIFQDPALPVEPNNERITSFLTPQNMVRNEKQMAETFYKDIYLIPAGHVLVVTSSHHTLRKYWELEPVEIRYRHDHEYVEHFRSLFFDVVGARLRSMQPIGAMLSGGVDSSSVVSTAQAIYREGRIDSPGFVSFSHVFDGLDCDERPLIEAIRDMYGFDARFVEFQASGGRLQRDPQGFYESPTVAFSQERNAILDQAQASGVRALLTGEIADSCIAGSWLVFDSLLRQGRIRELSRLIREYRQTIGTSRTVTSLYTLGPLLPLELQKQVTLLYTRRWLRQHLDDFGPRWMPQELRATLTQRASEAALEANRTRRFGNETRHWEYDLLYPPEVARYPAPWSLEIWRPFADRRLHQFLLGIPPEQKFATQASGEPYGRSKWLMRRAMDGVVPDAVRLRTTKTVFSQVRGHEINQNWAAWAEIFGPQGDSEVARHGYIAPDRFWSRLQQVRHEPRGTDMTYIMQMANLETWLRTFRLSRQQLTKIAVSPTATMPGAETNQIAAVT